MHKKGFAFSHTDDFPDLGSAPDWSCRVGNLIEPIRSTTQIRVVTRHQYGISALTSPTSFREETTGGVAKCRLFCRANTGNNIPIQAREVSANLFYKITKVVRALGLAKRRVRAYVDMAMT